MSLSLEMYKRNIYLEKSNKELMEKNENFKDKIKILEDECHWKFSILIDRDESIEKLKEMNDELLKYKSELENDFISIRRENESLKSKISEPRGINDLFIEKNKELEEINNRLIEDNEKLKKCISESIKYMEKKG